MTKQYTFFYNSQACNGCKACVTACKDKHDLPVGRNWRRVYEINGGDWIQVGGSWVSDTFAYYLSLSCNHCETALCTEVCPTTAMAKQDDGSVQVNQDACIGCRYCEWVCPYSAPQFDEENRVMTKCTGCQDYIAQGQKPACVAACPSRALDFGEQSDLEAKYGAFTAPELAANVYPLPDPALTQPSLIIQPHRNAKRTNGTKPYLANPEEV